MALSAQPFLKERMIITNPVDDDDSRSQYVVELSQGRFNWDYFDFPFRNGDFGHCCDSRADVHFYRDVCEDNKREWLWTIGGIEIGKYQIQPDQWFHRRFLRLPIDSIALVLSLVSAC